MRPRLPTFKPSQHQWIRQWRAALARRDDEWLKRPPELKALNLGDRARLRRAASGLELAGDPAVLTFARGLMQRGEKGEPADTAMGCYRLGLVAGVLAAVEDDLDKPVPGEGDATRTEIWTLGRRLGHSESGVPMMSELRFRRMLAVTEPEDLLRQWRRAVQLAKRRAHVASLADDLYTWLNEFDHPEKYATRSVRFHWAYDYYQQPRDTSSSGESTPASEAAE